MDNWLIFVVIIIGVISSFLNKKTKEVTKEQQPPPVYRQKEYTPAPAPVQQKTVSTTYNTPRAEKSQPSYRTPVYDKEEIKKFNAKNTGEGVSMEGISSESPTIMETAISDNIGKKETTDYSRSNSAIKPNQLAQGIIWAEILGPPRSRKPHNPFRK